ncbi:uncharacterized protein LOC119377859, partial [Rhipicephalus sanguineus]|uniref:uncharacterized protein LOC119377859 n=1 Tax=Rhipicephalus sanguineus TaxID=34632 RepID=UPI0018952A84
MAVSAPAYPAMLRAVAADNSVTRACQQILTMLTLWLVVVLVTLLFPVTSTLNVCAKPPAMSKMLKVLRPTSKVLVDCAADVIITYRANASLLAKIVQMVCEYHDECYDGILDIKDRATRRGIAGQCFLRKFLNIYPGFEKAEMTDGMR